MSVDTRTVVGRWAGLAGTEMVWAVDRDDAGRIVVEVDAADPLPADARPCVPAVRVRATVHQLRELVDLAVRVLEVAERDEQEDTTDG